MTGPSGGRLDTVDLALDGTVLVGGAIAGNDFGVVATPIAQGGTGVLASLSAPADAGTPGMVVSKLIRVGGEVTAVAVGPDGSTAFGGDFGIALLDPTGALKVSPQPLDATDGGTSSVVRRIAIGANGTIAALTDQGVTVFDSKLSHPVEISSAGGTDVAVDDANMNVIIAGTAAATTMDCGASFTSAYIRGFNYTGGAAQWTVYDVDAKAASSAGLCGATAASRAVIGRDGFLYFAGSAASTTSIFARDTRDPTQPAPLFAVDPYSNPGSDVSAPIAFLARFDLCYNTCIVPGLDGSAPSPGTKPILRATWLTGRANPDGTGAATGAQPTAIGADANGNLYVGGELAGYIANEQTLQIGGTPVEGRNGFVAVVSGDMTLRKLWTLPAAGSAPLTGLAVGGGGAAVVGVVEGDGGAALVAPIQSVGSGMGDGWVMVFPGP